MVFSLCYLSHPQLPISATNPVTAPSVERVSQQNSYLIDIHAWLVNYSALSLSLSPTVSLSHSLAFRALLQIQALQPLDPNEPIDDDEMTGNPKVQ